jgi:hypothetical protein
MSRVYDPSIVYLLAKFFWLRPLLTSSCLKF